MVDIDDRAEVILLLGIGFVAQLIDGALGMAYGVLSNTALLALGLPPAQASAFVDTAEVFTTAASAASHIYHRKLPRSNCVKIEQHLLDLQNIYHYGWKTGS